jgi:hypothetical protein
MLSRDGEMTLPFSGSTPLSRHSSYEGARTASERVGRQCLELLTAYANGPLTDREAAERVNLPIATICARRNELVKRGLVQAIDLIVGPFGVKNTRWGRG